MVVSWCESKAVDIYLTNWRQFFYASVLLLIINCVLTLSKWLWNHEPKASGSVVNFDNVMMQLASIRGQSHKKN